MPDVAQYHPWSFEFMKWLATHFGPTRPGDPKLREHIEQALIRHIQNRGGAIDKQVAVFSDDEGLMWIPKREVTSALKIIRMSREGAIAHGFLFDGDCLNRW